MSDGKIIQIGGGPVGGPVGGDGAPAGGPGEIDYSLLPKIGREAAPGELAKTYTQRMEAFEQRAEQVSYSGAFIRCDTHKMGAVTFTCPHCKEQDPVNPQGMIRTPYGYYLCQHCYGQYKLSALDLPQVLQTCCGLCLMDEFMRVRERVGPKKCVDMYQGKDAKKINQGLFK